MKDNRLHTLSFLTTWKRKINRPWVYRGRITYYINTIRRRGEIKSFVQTWRELKMVKSQAKTMVFSLTANSPNTQVSPSRGSRITDAFTIELSGKSVTRWTTQRQSTHAELWATIEPGWLQITLNLTCFFASQLSTTCNHKSQAILRFFFKLAFHLMSSM